MEVFSEIADLLPGFKGYLAPANSPRESLAMFVKNTLTIESIDYFFVHGPNSIRDEGIPLQHVQLTKGGKSYTICNFHGWWSPESRKRDTPERLEQSHNIKTFLDGIEGAKIICGDFNLAPDTESLLMLEQNMRNLIKDYHITSTRSSLYLKELKFADYTLVSDGIKVNDFKVLPDEISDHLAMYLDFS